MVVFIIIESVVDIFDHFVFLQNHKNTRVFRQVCNAFTLIVTLAGVSPRLEDNFSFNILILYSLYHISYLEQSLDTVRVSVLGGEQQRRVSQLVDLVIANIFIIIIKIFFA